ncbi:MAG: 2OG-Fe dioxygenase family protein, partial [Pseudomonadales bacterium]|nr:2OG-Fe dioxygenase family protein [Pseudomonadales bacterium]
IAREGVSGGETRVFDAAGPDGVRSTMLEPWSALLLDDARVMHETTPRQPEDPQVLGHRDTLVLTYRKEGFQAP